MPPAKKPEKIVVQSGQEAIDTALAKQGEGHNVTILIKTRGCSLAILNNRLREKGMGTLSNSGDETKIETTELLMDRGIKERREAIADLLQEVFEMPEGAVTVLIRE